VSAWTKKELESMLEDVVNELDLSEDMIAKHGPLATPPAELVRAVIDQKDRQIRMLQNGFVDVANATSPACQCAELREALKELITHTIDCEHALDVAAGLGDNAGAGCSDVVCEAQSVLQPALSTPPAPSAPKGDE
jgi:hypothetical protein